jgi:hypothetical protein
MTHDLNCDFKFNCSHNASVCQKIMSTFRVLVKLPQMVKLDELTGPDLSWPRGQDT